MKRIAILVETALASGRSLLAGISQYAREKDDWRVFHPTGYLGATELSGLESWEGDGIIARIPDRRTLEAIRKHSVPVVDVLGNVLESPYTVVTSDDRGIGEQVAEAFLENRHRHFGFVGLAGESWSREREDGFCRRLRDGGFGVDVCHLSSDSFAGGRWRERIERLSSWFRNLPRPCGVMIASDQLGPTVMEACQRLSLSIPEEVSLIGVDNDLPFCELCRPALSSVEPNHHLAGYEAARLLDAVLSGSNEVPSRLAVAPIQLHERLSSQNYAVEDPALLRALQCIRERACNGLSVDAVAREAGISRSVLQRRFRDKLNQTVLEVIHAVKMRRSVELLKLTQLPLHEVAERSGFSSQEYFTAAFGRAMGISPMAYRQRECGVAERSLTAEARAVGRPGRPD